MQQSMTGYGRDERTAQNFTIKSEIKTLNSKFLDLTPRYGKEIVPKEIEIKNIITEKLKRGKIMLSIEVLLTESSENDVLVDESLFKAYYAKLSELSSSVKAPTDSLLKLAFQAPEVIKQREISPDELPWKDILESVATACDGCTSYRNDEGAVLTQKLKDYASNIKLGLQQIEESDDSRANAIRARLQKNLDEIRDKVQVDENRFEQELIYYLEKIDITEEKVRLAQHLDYFIEILEKEDQGGKKLGFIAQEIGREINTIGSKANDADIQRTVVVMKDELEKIKEQSLNIL